MADKELRVRLKADDKITPAAKKAKSSLDAIPETVDVKVNARGFEDLADAAGSLPGPLGDAAGLVGQLGAAGGVGALAAGMFAAADAAADMAIEAKTTADLTGSTVEEASKLQNLWSRTGADVNDLNDVLLQMNGALAQSPELAKQIGVNLDDGKNITQRFVELTDKLASGQLTAVEASQLFGEEGVRQVGKLRTMYGGLSDDLENMPAPVDDEDVAQAIEMKKAVDQLKNTLTATVGIVGKELVPLFGDMATIANTAADALPGGKGGSGEGLLKWIRDYGTGIGLLAKGMELITGGGGLKFDEFAGGEFVAVIEDSADAADKANRATASYGRTIRETAEAARELMGVEDEAADQRRALADSEFAYRDAQRDLVTAIQETSDALKESAPATLEGAAALDEFAQQAGTAADAAVRMEADQMEAAGATQSAAQAQTTWNSNMLQSARTTSGPMQQAIVNYIAKINGIPPEKVSEILANPDYATIDAANAAIDKAAADETARIIAEADTAAAARELDEIANRRRTAVIQARVAYTENVNLGGSNAPVPRSVTPAAAGMSTYAAAPGAVPTGLPPIVVNVPVPVAVAPSITINAGVVGNRFDVQRTVSKALRRHRRLNGERE